MEREKRLHEKLSGAVRSLRYGAGPEWGFALEEALNAWLGMQRDYGTLGAVYRMQLETLAITLAGGGLTWAKLSDARKEQARETARKIGASR
jgi:hypothetical protein